MLHLRKVCPPLSHEPRQVQLDWDTEDEIWVATVPVLPGCSAHGETQEEALREINEAITCYLEAELGVDASFVPPVPDIATLKKASKVLNKTEVARLLGLEPRTPQTRMALALPPLKKIAATSPPPPSTAPRSA